jgi:RNA polymerase sigma-70 factor (sigma-E family)
VNLLVTDSEAAREMTVAELAAADGLALLRFAYLLCGDRHLAEDLLQDVLAAMHRRFPEDLPLDDPAAYARRALVNTNISRARRMSAAEIAVDAIPDAPVTDVDLAAQRDGLWQALRRLPVRQRTVLVLRFYADMADPDIAAALGARRGTVRSLASRAIAALRDDPALREEDR